MAFPRAPRGTGVKREVRRERRSAVVTVTHDRRMIEGFDAVYYLNDGRLSRTPETVH